MVTILHRMEIIIAGSKPELTSTPKPRENKFAFMSGLPRSGSTLLASILNQNPEIHSGANSPMCGMMWHLERSIVATEQFNAYPKMHVVPSMVRGILEAFYSDRSEQLIIDKSREWSMPQHFEVLKRVLPYEPKIIVCVRSVLEVLASFINLVHINSKNVSFIDQEIQTRNEFHFYRHPDDIRADSLMRPKGPIDNAIYGIAFACQPENAKYFHFVEYDDLVSNTKQTIDAIYSFLGIQPFEHNFAEIENKFHERDETYGLYGMHDVRRRVSRSTVNVGEVLTPYIIQRYSNMEFWRHRESIG